MKKFLSVMIVVSMLIVMMTGCSGEKSPTDVAREKIESYKANAESILNGEEDSDARVLEKMLRRRLLI